MKRLALFAIALFLLPGTPSNAQPAFDGCRSAGNMAARTLVQGRHLWITNARVERVEGTYDNFPVGRPNSVSISFSGNDASNVMNSPVLLTAIAQRIMDSCNSFGAVSFHMAETDWSRTFGWIGGRAREFECVDPGQSFYQWGQTPCL